MIIYNPVFGKVLNTLFKLWRIRHAMKIKNLDTFFDLMDQQVISYIKYDYEDCLLKVEMKGAIFKKACVKFRGRNHYSPISFDPMLWLVYCLV